VLDGRDMTALAPVARRFGMVFQHYALFPHLDVGANVAFGLRAGREGRSWRGGWARRCAGGPGRLRAAPGGQPVGQPATACGWRGRWHRNRASSSSTNPLESRPGLRERTRRELRALVHRLGITAVVVSARAGGRVRPRRPNRAAPPGRLEQLTRRTAVRGACHGVRGRRSSAGRARCRRRSFDRAGRVVHLADPVGRTGMPAPGVPARLLAARGLRLAAAAPSRLTGP
jgi:hypothetical protein